jgi:hypothetical protein
MSDNPSPIDLAEQVEAHLRRRLGQRVRALRVVLHQGAVVLRGRASSYYDKQLAQHVVMEEIKLRVLANEIEVTRREEQ